ncbi:MAG: bifunctional UDP-N-acetylglucosamine diphosphorylase/glucosamine-1-phosphate N-acetyltransferase GlmU [Burkholderiales bacterium]|nr:bifunctional UDP-N-acetylglucosamine diphosphorylase/glucosamine-1-phosphate N-acetyltransferase GlmU [Burkholderiales bacterium]
MDVVILAAGQGRRMYSDLPKVLHKIGNKSLLDYVIATALKLTPTNIIIVYGHQGDTVRCHVESSFIDNKFIWVYQEQQLGTGHALKCALPHLSINGKTLLLYGDVPLVEVDSLAAMLNKYEDNIVMLSAVLDNPTGYGRVIRNNEAQIKGIVEEKDATQSERFIKEINTGFYVLPNKYLTNWLSALSNNNSQNEYYVTDLIAMAYDEAIDIDYVEANHQYSIMGVNNKLQLEYLERILRQQRAELLLAAGATLIDKTRIDIRGEISVGKDCIIDANCIFIGKVVLGNRVKIGAGVILHNVVIEDDSEVKPYSIIEDAQIKSNCIVGPFARIRPGSIIEQEAHIGNFVEIKNSQIGPGSKVNHLTYIGDAEIGSGVNVGAGSVTCNYDGKNKFKTIIGDNVFVGSGTMMVAPVVLGEGGVIGAGSTITKNTPPHELTVSRAKQVTIFGWLKKKRK